MKARPWTLWIVAVVIMAGTAVYQRRTGPTYPVRGVLDLGGERVRFSLPRTYDGPDDAGIRIAAPPSVTGWMTFRRFRSDDDWSRRDLTREKEYLAAYIPHQPAAGKVIYRIVLSKDGRSLPATPEPLIIRFRNSVPTAVLIPHVALMFLALLFACRAGLEDWARGPNVYPFTVGAVISLAIGGLVLGPLMQKYAFGAYWTGWPLGHDLTDNKTAAALLLWLIAFLQVRKNREKRGWAAAALVLTLVVYLIPHSVLGSELDYRQLGP